ncbi:uncharacterized protein LOC134679688 [Cydia fagiglandana]|uniref:uncharacterized protein LOC134679688 n=1 Tax=Cydia fagiglandana TaxID=1458189 RepID=UPI002FEDF928
MIKALIFLSALVACESQFSSFWAPLFDRSILNYRVDASFDPDAGRRDRDEYVKNYGVRGEKLIAELGNGRGPSGGSDRVYDDVKFYYTYGRNDLDY